MIVESPEPDAKLPFGNEANVQIVNECPVNVKSKLNGSKKVGDVVDVVINVEVEVVDIEELVVEVLVKEVLVLVLVDVDVVLVVELLVKVVDAAEIDLLHGSQ